MKKIRPVKAYFSNEKNLFDAIKNIFGFYPGNIFLYKLALRHKSASHEIVNGAKLSNERLEYLGDAILSAIIADYLFKIFPFKDEGFLTEMRSKIVSRAQLNELSRKLGLDKLIEVNHDGKNLFKSINGDAFEAFIGALYLDKGYEFTKDIVVNHIVGLHFDIDVLARKDINFKSKLLEFVQKEKREIEFKLIGEEGNGHRKQYVVEVFIDNVAYGKAQDYSIKGAEQLAAEKACSAIIIDKE